jgi:hypothetical protein
MAVLSEDSCEGVKLVLLTSFCPETEDQGH